MFIDLLHHCMLSSISFHRLLVSLNGVSVFWGDIGIPIVWHRDRKRLYDEQARRPLGCSKWLRLEVQLGKTPDTAS